jgi:hypothetical protein
VFTSGGGAVGGRGLGSGGMPSGGVVAPRGRGGGTTIAGSVGCRRASAGTAGDDPAGDGAASGSTTPSGLRAAAGIGGGPDFTTPTPFIGVCADAGRPEPGGRDPPCDTVVEVIRSDRSETRAAPPVYRSIGMGNHQAFAVLCALALGACPTVDLGDTPAEIGACNPAKGIDYFKSDIEPKFFKLADTTNGCARSGSCHDQAHGLTLDRTVPIDDAANYKVSQGYLNCGQPQASLILTKPLAGIEGHGGGDIYPNLSDPAVVTFLQWFQ